MKLTFDRKGDPLPVSQRLLQILDKVADKSGKITASTTALTFNFWDKSYSAETGGWHPVEIRISKENDLWDFEYITSFSYQGWHYPELEKDTDFDFSCGLARVLNGTELPIGHPAIVEYYPIWEIAFVDAFDLGAFDEIEISAETR